MAEERELVRKISPAMEPLLRDARFKGAKGGRAGGKSHFFAEDLVLDMVEDQSLRAVCIREIQRSIKFSAKHLIESKIQALGVEDYFKIYRDEIVAKRGDGVIAFAGMQDHTAESIKGYEDFDRAWFEEAQRMSAKSWEILEPTIRAPGSQIWFSWNPEDPEDPVEKLFNDELKGSSDALLVTCNYTDNRFCPPEAIAAAERMRALDSEQYEHVWLGGYNRRNQAQVLGGKWRVDEFEPSADWDGPYYGADWGHSKDPTVLVRFWLAPGKISHRLMIEHEAFGYGFDLTQLPELFDRVPGSRDHVIRADPARPETIQFMRQQGFNVIKAKSWKSVTHKGVVQEGIAWLRKAEEIVIHVRCTEIADEAKGWCYKVDRITGDPLPDLKPGNDHGWDSVRYGASPIIKSSGLLVAFA